MGFQSHPARGAWIEIGLRGIISLCTNVAPRMGCVDRNIRLVAVAGISCASHPARGAWLEMRMT